MFDLVGSFMNEVCNTYIRSNKVKILRNTLFNLVGYDPMLLRSNTLTIDIDLCDLSVLEIVFMTYRS